MHPKQTPLERPLQESLRASGTPRVSSAVGWLLIGLALRALLLPLAAHPDLLSVYDRVRLWVAGGFALSDYSFQALPILLHRAFSEALAMTPVDVGGIAWPGPSEEAIFNEAARVFGLPGAPLALALWKLPYLVLDLLAGWLASRLVPERWSVRVLALWMVNPVLLYVTGVFAKYEALMLVPLLVGLLDLKRGREGAGFLWIGVAAAMRLYPWIVVVPMILAAAPTLRRRAELAFLALAPLVCVLGGCAWRSGPGWLAVPLGLALLWTGYARTRGRPLEWVPIGLGLAAGLLAVPRVLAALATESFPVTALEHHARFLLFDPLGGAGSDRLLLFPLAYAAVLLWAHGRARGRRRSADARAHGEPLAGEAFEDVLDAALLAALAWFALAFFHPQYTALLVALVLLRLHRIPFGLNAHGLQVAGILLTLVGFLGGNTTVRLFLPLAPQEVLALPGPLDVLPPNLGELPWPGLGRTLIALGAAWMAFALVRARRPDPDARPSAVRAPLWIGGVVLWPAAALAYVGALLPHESLQPVTRPQEVQQSLGAGGRQQRLRFTPPEGSEDGTVVEILPPVRPPASSSSVVVRVFQEDAGAAPVLQSTLPRAALFGERGATRVPLPGLHPEPGREYELALEFEAPPSAAAPPRIRFLRDVRGAELLAKVVDAFRTRFARTYVWWLVPAVFAGAAGAALLLLARRPGLQPSRPVPPPR